MDQQELSSRGVGHVSSGLSRVLAAVAIVCVFASGACRREQIDDVAASVNQTVQTAKQGAERVKTELPAATQRARDELAAVRDAVKQKIEGTSEKVRDEADTLREKAH